MIYYLLMSYQIFLHKVNETMNPYNETVLLFPNFLKERLSI